jgi:hypothetical protein
MTGRPLEGDSRAKQQSELEAALYWSALNFSTLCGLQGGAQDKSTCTEEVRKAAGRLRELLAERGVGRTDGAARLAFVAGVFDFNIATHCERCCGPPALSLLALEVGDCNGADPHEAGGAAAARLVRRGLGRFREANRVWLGLKGPADLDTAASVTMVAACLSRLGEVEEAAEWAERDYQTRLQLQARSLAPAPSESWHHPSPCSI